MTESETADGLLAEIVRLDNEETRTWNTMLEKEATVAHATNELREATRTWANAYSKSKVAAETYKSANAQALPQGGAKETHE